MNDRFRGLMNEAARLTREGRLDEATRTIQLALAGVVAARRHAGADATDVTVVDVVDPPHDTGALRVPAPSIAGAPSSALDPSVVRDPSAAPGPSVGPMPWADPFSVRGRPVPPRPATPVGPRPADADDRDADDRDDRDERDDGGRFVAGRHALGSLSRDYRLYVPPGETGSGRALVVMLHGCTQDAADFAAGTRMNEHARERDVFVLYPEQSRRANPQRCWNWFKHTHQQRHRGEPALIASMTRAIVERHGIDPRRVYVAGLSAGGAMAAIVAACHPELFAAVGVHSGLAPDAAANLPEALAAMQGGAGTTGPGVRPAVRADAGPDGRARRLEVPTIVFHGDVDRTVHPSNGERVVEAAAGRTTGARSAREEQASARGRRYTRRLHGGDAGLPDVEHWIVHGAGHAWSGGSPAGSWTDQAGPDATAEMLRFFLEHPLPATDARDMRQA